MDIFLVGLGVLIAFLAWQFPKLPRHSTEPKEQEKARNADSRSAASEDNQPQSPAAKNRGIPDGITFGTKVAIVPGFERRLFNHTGSIEDRVLNGRAYTWIKRDDVIARYRLDIPNGGRGLLREFAGSESVTADVLSPVSGLLLHSIFSDQETWPDEEEVNERPPVAFAVLLPDDEPDAVNGRWLFHAAADLVRSYQHIFEKPSPYWTHGKPILEEEFFQRLEQQLSRNCIVLDALPYFQDYLDDARNKYPELRPYLKHLR